MSAPSHSSVMFLSSSDKYLFALSLYSGFQYSSLVKLFLVVQLEVRFGDTKFPFLVYLHGGGFFIKSAFSSTYHAHLNVVFTNTISVYSVFLRPVAAKHYCLRESAEILLLERRILSENIFLHLHLVVPSLSSKSISSSGSVVRGDHHPRKLKPD
ncbi:unnamed protein product [Coffea canephora]|uniref:Alpha/beta hydrolase fold-3 domain-containing protein n=1 Tax=Coffea canephora TaxID=49390 RepID=A0A068V7X0_COFCA|nr:unnamed protein product [Coffea canephora]